MEINHIIDRLALQVHSNQEGFDVLSNARNLHDMANHFSRILRGTLLTTEIGIHFTEDEKLNWKNLFNSFKSDYKIDKFLAETYKQKISIVKVRNKNLLFGATPLFDQSLIAVLLGTKFDKQEYTDFDKISFQILLQLFSNAHQTYLSRQTEKELVFSLNYRVMQLNNLIDTGIELSKLGNSSSLFDSAIESLAGLTNASKIFLNIKLNDKIKKEFSFPQKFKLDEIIKSKVKIESSFTENGSEYNWILADKETRKGITDFDATDELLLTSITRQVQAALENAKLHTEIIEKENIERELAVAGSIQKKILPDFLPEINGYDIAGINIPSKEVGGDYYNVIELRNGKYAMIMADVAGKGMPASLLVSTLDAALSAYLDMEIPLDEMANKINTIIYKASPLDKFITFFIAVLESESGELDIINAGHNPSLILTSDNELRLIEAGGVAFGMFDMGLPFTGEKIILKKGERLFMFTDGIPEAMNKDEVEYSDERMEKLFKSKRPKKSQTFINNIVKDIKKFTGNTPQSDDITALYLIRHQ